MEVDFTLHCALAARDTMRVMEVNNSSRLEFLCKDSVWPGGVASVVLSRDDVRKLALELHAWLVAGQD